MIGRLQSVALRVAIACAMALSLLLAPTGGSSSHDPFVLAEIEAERDLELAAEIAEHGHNAADHLHDTPACPPSMTALTIRTGAPWCIGAAPKPLPERVFVLDRPPRA